MLLIPKPVHVFLALTAVARKKQHAAFSCGQLQYALKKVPSISTLLVAQPAVVLVLSPKTEPEDVRHYGVFYACNVHLGLRIKRAIQKGLIRPCW